MNHSKKASAMQHLPAVTEGQFLDQIIDLARLFGWRCAHFRPSRVIKNGKETWRTAVSADGKGFPDLILVHDSVILAVELKSEKGKTSPSQREWLSALEKAGIKTYIWKPSDWDDILRCLSNDSKITFTNKRVRDMSSDIPD